MPPDILWMTAGPYDCPERVPIRKPVIQVTFDLKKKGREIPELLETGIKYIDLALSDDQGKQDRGPWGGRLREDRRYFGAYQ